MRIQETTYLDYQASTPVDPEVFREMAPFFGARFGNPHSSEHTIGWRASAVVEAAAADVAHLVGSDADEVIFTSGATEANNLALLGLSDLAAQGARRRILVSAIEHKSVLSIGRVLESHHGCTVEHVPVAPSGLIDARALQAALGDDVLLVSVIAVNNEIGTIQDVPQLAAVTRAAGAYFHCDAAQAPCAMDVSDLSAQADLISLSSHKMYGPAGIGALIARRDLQRLLKPIIHGGGQQNGLRSGTLPLPLCVGMGAAARLLSAENAPLERERVRRQRNIFISRLADLGWAAELNGIDGFGRHPGNANLLFRGFAASDILAAVQPRLAASSGSACTSGVPEPSHVLRAIGRTTEEAEASIRFSFGRFNTDEDADKAAAIVASALLGLERAELRELA